VWLGVSVESKAWLWRVDELRKVLSVVHFISAEPLLEDISPALSLNDIEWLIVGGESGAGFRPMDHAWARALRDHCQREGVAFFFKQSAGLRTETGIVLDARIHHGWPAVGVERNGNLTPPEDDVYPGPEF
jgi:protein gp37